MSAEGTTLSSKAETILGGELGKILTTRATRRGGSRSRGVRGTGLDLLLLRGLLCTDECLLLVPQHTLMHLEKGEEREEKKNKEKRAASIGTIPSEETLLTDIDAISEKRTKTEKNIHSASTLGNLSEGGGGDGGRPLSAVALESWCCVIAGGGATIRQRAYKGGFGSTAESSCVDR
jgi:uncharacterized protein YjhX (UPF0386 family)